MSANGNQCTEDQSGQVNCGPTFSSQSNSPTSSGSSATTHLTVTSSVTSEAVTTTTPPLSGSTSSSSGSSSSTQLAVPSASPGQNYTVTSDDPSISYNNGPSSSDAWVPSNISIISTDPSCANVGVVHSTTQVDASLTFPFVGVSMIFHSFSIGWYSMFRHGNLGQMCSIPARRPIFGDHWQPDPKLQCILKFNPV